MITYFFCKLFKIIRVKNYIVFPDKTFKEIKIKNIPDVILFKSNNDCYNVVKIVTEIVNDTLNYNWIDVEKINK
jgi:hypothetical protein